MGIILALSRAFIQETGVAFDPELALLEVVAHTHYLPRHWRGRAHTREVHDNFQALFPFKVSTRQYCLWVSHPAACHLLPCDVSDTAAHLTHRTCLFIRVTGKSGGWTVRPEFTSVGLT